MLDHEELLEAARQAVNWHNPDSSNPPVDLVAQVFATCEADLGEQIAFPPHLAANGLIFTHFFRDRGAEAEIAEVTAPLYRLAGAMWYCCVAELGCSKVQAALEEARKHPLPTEAALKAYLRFCGAASGKQYVIADASRPRSDWEVHTLTWPEELLS